MKNTNTNDTQAPPKKGSCLGTCLKGLLYLALLPYYWIYSVIWLLFLRKKKNSNNQIMKKATTKHIILMIISILSFISLFITPADTSTPNTNNETNVSNTDSETVIISNDETTINSKESVVEELTPLDEMTVHFLDVGQGLCILVECSGEYLIYDGGGRDTSSYVVAYLKEQGVTNLKYLISSHYDEDHLAGLIGCLNAFNVENVIGADYVPDTDLYTSFISKADSLELEIQHSVPGNIYNLGTASITILSPTSFDNGESNNNSIAIKLTNGKTAFLFAGDAEHKSEKDMINSNINLKSDVLCVGHHGSADSTIQEFLDAVLPTSAVISCGENNLYSHPDTETLNRLKSTISELFRTDKQGTIIAKSDGTTISWNVSPCNDFSSGESSQEDIYVSLIDNTTDSYSDSVGSKSSVSEQTSVESPAADTPAQTTDSQTTNNNSDEGSNFDKYNTPEQQNTTMSWVLNTNSKKIHYPSCKSVAKIAPHNYSTSNETLDTLRSQGYDTCGNCFK